MSIFEQHYGKCLDHTQAYASTRNLVITDYLGSGYDGVVHATSRPSVIKAVKYYELFEREVAVYQRLRQRRVVRVGRFTLPRLIEFDSEFLVVEMTFVTPPFILDFSAAGLDRHVIAWTEEELAERRKEASDRFGKHWPEVVKTLWILEQRLGIYLADLHRGNIRFGDESHVSDSQA